MDHVKADAAIYASVGQIKTARVIHYKQPLEDHIMGLSLFPDCAVPKSNILDTIATPAIEVVVIATSDEYGVLTQVDDAADFLSVILQRKRIAALGN